jgi:hypothetical protein
MTRFVLSALAPALFALAALPGVSAAGPIPKGPLEATYVVPASSTDVLTVTLRGGELTRVRISGDGGTCLELRVYDENGNLLASDTFGLGDDRSAAVFPKQTGKVKIRVANLGINPNKYRIVVD